MEGIMDVAKEAAQTMRMGGGIGFDFSTIRPRGSRIISLDSEASGAVSFMEIYDAVCGTVSSAGNRRGAMMAVLRVDHPDIEEFIHAKQNKTQLRNFNISVGITDAFMEAVRSDSDFELNWNGHRPYRIVNARSLFDQIMRATWEWAEPGVLFIDRINEMNNLHYIEDIAATNPCAEQPLPPWGACLLASLNLVKYVSVGMETKFKFDWNKFRDDIAPLVRAVDNVIDGAIFPLPEQELEALHKRRLGIGVTGLANAGEAVTGESYGSPKFLQFTAKIMKALQVEAYKASIELAKEKGAFPLFDKEKYLESKFVKTLPKEIQEDIGRHGIRNSHLLSIAPTGTISLAADNVSSGIEPVFRHEYQRTIIMADGPVTETVRDYGLDNFGVKGATADEISIDDHLSVLITTQKYIDSAVSKTCNVGADVSWEDFQNIYMTAWEQGCKGCTTHRDAGSREGIMQETEEGAACHYDPDTGAKSCD
jgi:ribonucleoside-diphosphate reductase alpha chain